MPRHLRPVARFVVALAVVVSAAACGGGDESTEAPETTPSSEATTASDDSGTVAESTTTTTPTTTEADSEPAESEPEEPAADLVIDGALEGGEVIIDARRFEVTVGSSVLITFESDEPEHIHLHGYDILVDLAPGEPAELAFVADSPGSFEIELEDSGRFLFELLVR